MRPRGRATALRPVSPREARLTRTTAVCFYQPASTCKAAVWAAAASAISVRVDCEARGGIHQLPPGGRDESDECLIATGRSSFPFPKPNAVSESSRRKAAVPANLARRVVSLLESSHSRIFTGFGEQEVGGGVRGRKQFVKGPTAPPAGDVTTPPPPATAVPPGPALLAPPPPPQGRAGRPAGAETEGPVSLRERGRRTVEMQCHIG